jgi:protease III
MMLSKFPFYSLRLLILSSLLITACSNIEQKAAKQTSDLPIHQEEIVKSPNDTRLYRSITLENQLEVVLVSDPSIEKSAAALSVKVGSFQEPKEFGGLAHYLEHMLFLGTKTYPEVGDYSEFVSRNGGTQNAYTQLDHTNYMVAVNNTAYDEALKRFSGFFYEATLDQNYADKERNAVHSEWTMKSPNDWVILSQLDGLTLNSAHPIHQFNWGNLNSLVDKGDLKLQNALLDLYNTYYSANLMKAVMISNLPLDEMQSLANKYFGLIPNKHTPIPQVMVPVATADNLHKIVRYVPQAEMKQLRISFVMKDNAQQFAVKPNGFVNYLLNNEMPGTLASTLRDLGFSEGLYTNYDAEEYGNAGSFNLYIDLTETGLNNRDMVMAAVIRYLDLMRTQGVDVKYFAEIKQSLSNSFRFKEKTNDYNYAMQIAADLQHVPTEYVLSHDYEYQRFSPQAIQQVLDQLTLNNARVFYIDKNQATDTPMENFEGHYSIQNITPETLALWRSLGQNVELNLPRVNRLMPENFDIVSAQFTDKPIQIAKEPGFSAFLGHSANFEQPKGLVTLDLNSGVTKATPRNQVIAELLNRGLSQALVELQNEAIGGGMGLNVNLFNGLSITTNGFSDKQGILLSQALKQILEYKMSDAELENFKAAFKSDMISKKKGILLNQLFPKFSQIVTLDEYSDDTLLAEVDGIEVNELNTLKQQLLKQANLRVFAFGNYNERQINEMSQLVLAELPKDRQQMPIYESPKLKPKAGQIYNWQEDVALTDIGLVTAYISERNVRETATAQILSQLMQPALFKQIRTEEQLAYAVGFFSQTNKDQMLTAFYIQSPAKGLAEVDARINAFREAYKTQLANLSEQEFSTTKNSILVSLTQPPKNLNEEMGQFIGDWRDQNYAYDSRTQLIEALKEVTLPDVISLYNKLQDGRSFGQLMVQMRGTNFADKDFVTIKGAETVKDIDAFHKSQLK